MRVVRRKRLPTTAVIETTVIETYFNLEVDKSGRFVTKINHNILGKNSNMLPPVVAKMVPNRTSSVDEFVEPTPMVEPTPQPLEFSEDDLEDDEEPELAEEPEPFGR